MNLFEAFDLIILILVRWWYLTLLGIIGMIIFYKLNRTGLEKKGKGFNR